MALKTIQVAVTYDDNRGKIQPEAVINAMDLFIRTGEESMSEAYKRLLDQITNVQQSS